MYKQIEYHEFAGNTVAYGHQPDKLYQLPFLFMSSLGLSYLSPFFISLVERETGKPVISEFTV